MSQQIMAKQATIPSVAVIPSIITSKGKEWVEKKQIQAYSLALVTRLKFALELFSRSNRGNEINEK